MKASLSIFSSKGVKPFLLRFLLFLSLLIGVDWVVGTIIEQIHRRAPYSCNWTKENWLLDKQFDVIIFGSSRAFRHYVPSVISEETGLSVFNAGQNGQYLLYSYALEQLLLERYSPKAIILDVLPCFIVKGENPAEEFERLSSLSPYIHNHQVRQLLTRGNFFQGLKYASKMYRFNSKILSILDNLRKQSAVVDNGYEVIGDIRFHDRNPFRVDLLQKVEIDSFKLNILKQFIRSAQDKNIPVAVSFSPVSGPLSSQTQSILTIYSELLQEMNVPFLDFATASYADKELFLDIIHMDGVGAQLFSREFGQTLARLYHLKNPIFLSQR